MKTRKDRRALLAALAALLVPAGVFCFYFLGKRAPRVPSSQGKKSEQKALLIAGSDEGYVDAKVCQTCHAGTYKTYQQTGMGRSFYRLQSGKSVEDWSAKNVFYHPASDGHYTMYERDGRYYQRRHQIGFEGREANVVEKEIHFVIGSGNHARTYLHRTADGKLLQLPVAWYSEKNGFWAMNPGYDRPDHQGFRRRITHECMFCHNAYPEIEPGSDGFGRESLYNGNIPEGIDCQRCHGPGRDHLRAVQAQGAKPETIRETVVNPARLSADRQLELCMQCHLETTSARLPPYLRRYNRGFFSFRPGEPLVDYLLHFDHAPGSGHGDKFEIVSAPYRLRMSACFQKSNGTMGCTTCHDPHDIPRGQEAPRHYVAVCQGCHRTALEKLVASNRHTGSSDCLRCHMPKRRTDDVVHVIMTDHYIQRFQPARDLLAPLQEDQFYDRKYQGDVVYYYPPGMPPGGESELYLAVAQVTASANLAKGIPRLEKAIEKYRPTQAEFYFELAEGHSKTGQLEKAIPIYEEAIRRKSDLWLPRHRLGLTLSKAHHFSRAAEELEKAAEMGTERTTTLTDLALVYRQQGKLDDAIAALRNALTLDPDSPQAYNNLGGALLEKGDRDGAEIGFRDAIRVQPDFAAAHNNLAKVLAARADFRQAKYHFEKAIQNNSKFAQARYDYGLTLTQMEQYDKAEAQLEAAIRLEPAWAEAHNTLGEVVAIRRKTEEAILHYERALELNPTYYEAHFNLGSVLVLKKNLRQARVHFEKAAESPDPAIRQGALESMEKLTHR